tara:strand:- start:2243 stop:3640 length:1398 start_codon:yes stop_codon:yes gene_type:complete
MSIDLQDYFNLGLESTNNTVDNAGLINVFRTPVDTSSANLNRITFKIPKTGLITSDSMVTVQFVGEADSGNITPNFINGAIGCIKRTRILVDNKVLVDLQKPGLAENVKLYSRNTQIELAESQYKLMGNQFRSTVNSAGEEIFDIKNSRYYETADPDIYAIDRNIIKGVSDSKVYGIPLKYLGAEFLEAASLPVFLLGQREMVLELTFHSDSGQYACNTFSTSVIASNSVKVNLANCELVTTHIQLSDEVEQQERMNLVNEPVQYPLLDTYVINGVVPGGVVGQASNHTYRLNAQNREVHNILMVPHNQSGEDDKSMLCANQRSMSLGNVTLQTRVNGQNVYDRPISNQTVLYGLTTYSENNMALKLPINACRVDSKTLVNFRQSASKFYLDYRGSMNYLKQDFTNGNAGVFGSGTLFTTAAEIDYSVVPAVNASPDQTDQRDMLFYVSVSKLLQIGATTIDISY